MMSFVYDIADLYKLQTSVITAFESVSSPRIAEIGQCVRIVLRRLLRELRVLARIADDLGNR